MESHFTEWLWTLPTFIGGIGVLYLRSLGASVNKILTAIEVQNTRVLTLEKSSDDYEDRLRSIERGCPLSKHALS